MDDPREGLSRDDRIYIAAIIDGEGCVTIKRRHPIKARRERSPRHHLSIFVGNTNRLLIEYLQQTIPGRTDYRIRSSARHKDVYVWEVNDRRAAQVAEAIRPFLKLKGPQADILIDYHRTLVAPARGNPDEGRQQLMDDEVSRRDAFYWRIRALNRKGPPAETEREDPA